MPHPIDAVLFDMNHTLIHPGRTGQSHMAYTYAALAPHCWALSFEAFAEAWEAVHAAYDAWSAEGLALLRAGAVDAARSPLREPLYRENIAAILARLDLSVRLADEVTAAFQQSWRAGVTMPADTPALLNRLAGAGCRLGLVTNFQQPDMVPDLLAQFGLDGLLDPIIISAEVGLRKPHPDIFRAALEALGLADTPERVIYVGDTPSDDIEGALWAGLNPVLIDTRGRYPNFPDVVPRIERLDALLPAHSASPADKLYFPFVESLNK